VVGSGAGARLFEEAGERFHYVVVDIPPLCALVDAKAIAPYVNDFDA
jgi:Mrp family chromosome partitioning ATPase